MMPYNIVMLDILMSYAGMDERLHPVLVQSEESAILVDCGFVGSLPLIEGALEQCGTRAEEITAIVLTHHDHDHMGAAAAFKRKYPGVQICASQQEAPYISAKEKPLRLVQAEELQELLSPEQQDFGRAFCGLLKTVEPVEVDVLLREHDCLLGEDCRVISTPGHTPGHISLYINASKTIIAGDAVALIDGKPMMANPQFALDKKAALASMAKLQSMDAETILCYHGGEYRVQ